MNNGTSYEGRTLRRWIQAAFRHRGHAYMTKGLKLDVRYSRHRGCSGRAGVTSMTLTLPRDPTWLNAADLSYVLDYLILLMLGYNRREMSQSQKTRSDEVRSWAKDLPLPKFQPKEKTKPSASEQRKAVIERRAQHAQKMFAKYDLLEAAAAKELLNLGTLKKKWEAKIAYYQKRGVL